MDQHRRTLAKYALAIASVAAMPAAARAESSEAPQPRDPDAEQFVQTAGQRLISILADKSEALPDKIAAFRAAVDDVADVPGITKFVLGKYARAITTDQMQAFAPLFEDYVEKLLLQHLSDFHADTLTVKNSATRVPGEVLVKTTLTGPGAKPSELGWRVLGSGASWKVIDIEISGGSLAFFLRNDFVSTIDDQQGDIGALISRLQREVRRPAAASASH